MTGKVQHSGHTLVEQAQEAGEMGYGRADRLRENPADRGYLVIGIRWRFRRYDIPRIA